MVKARGVVIHEVFQPPRGRHQHIDTLPQRLGLGNSEFTGERECSYRRGDTRVQTTNIKSLQNGRGSASICNEAPSKTACFR